MWAVEGFYKGFVALISIVFLIGVAVGFTLAKIVPWLMAHVRIEWVS